MSGVCYTSKHAMTTTTTTTTTTPTLTTAMRISYELVPASSRSAKDRRNSADRVTITHAQNRATNPSVSACAGQLRCAGPRRPPSTTTAAETTWSKDGTGVVGLPSSSSSSGSHEATTGAADVVVVDTDTSLTVEEDGGIRILSGVTGEEDKEAEFFSQDDVLGLEPEGYSPLPDLSLPPSPEFSLDNDNDVPVPEMQRLRFSQQHKSSCEPLVSSPVAQEDAQLGERAGDREDTIAPPCLRREDMSPSLDLEFLVSYFSDMDISPSPPQNDHGPSNPSSLSLSLPYEPPPQQLVTADVLCLPSLPTLSLSPSPSLSSDSAWFTPYDDIDNGHDHAQQANSTLTASSSSSSDVNLASSHSAPYSLFEAFRGKEEMEEEQTEGRTRLAASAAPSAASTLTLLNIDDGKALMMSQHVVRSMYQSISGLQTIVETEEDEDESGGLSSQSAGGGIEALGVPYEDGNVADRPMTAEVSSHAIKAVSSECTSYSAASFDGKELIEDDAKGIVFAMDDRHRVAQPQGEEVSGQLKSPLSSLLSLSSMSSARTLTALLTSDNKQCAQTPTPDRHRGEYGYNNNTTGVQKLSLGAPTIWSPIELKAWSSVTLTYAGKEGRHRSFSSLSSPSSSEAVALAAIEGALEGAELDRITRAVRDAQHHEARCLLDVHLEFGAHRWGLLSDGTEVLSSAARLIQGKGREQARRTGDPLIPLCTVLTAIKRVPVPLVFHCVISETEHLDRQGLPSWFNVHRDPVVRMTLQHPRARSQALNRPWPPLALGDNAHAGSAATTRNPGPNRPPLVGGLKSGAAEFVDPIDAPVYANILQPQLHSPVAYSANASPPMPAGIGACSADEYCHSIPGLSDVHLTVNKSAMAPVKQASIYQAPQQQYLITSPPQHIVQMSIAQPALQSFFPIPCHECTNSAGATWHFQPNVLIFPAPMVWSYLPVDYTFYPIHQLFVLPQIAPAVTTPRSLVPPNVGTLTAPSMPVYSAVTCAPIPGQELSSHLDSSAKSRYHHLSESPLDKNKDMCPSLELGKVVAASGPGQCTGNEDIPVASISSYTSAQEQDLANAVVPELDNPLATLKEEQPPLSLEYVPTSRSRRSSAVGPDPILDDLASGLGLTTLQLVEDEYSRDVETALYSCACATGDLDLLEPQPTDFEGSALVHASNSDRHQFISESTYGASSLAPLADERRSSGPSPAVSVSSFESCTLESSRAGLKYLLSTFVSSKSASVCLSSSAVCPELPSSSCLLELDFSSDNISSSSSVLPPQEPLTIASSSLSNTSRTSLAEAVGPASFSIQDFEGYNELILNTTSISLNAEPSLFEEHQSQAMLCLPLSSEAPATCPVAILVNLPARKSQAEDEEEGIEELDSILSYSSISLVMSSPEELRSGIVTNIPGTTIVESESLEEMSPQLPSLDPTSLIMIDADMSLYNMSWRHSISFLEAIAPSSQGSSGAASRAMLVSPLGWIGMGVGMDVCVMDDGERSRLEELELELDGVD